MVVKILIAVLEVLDNIVNFRFGSKWVIGMCLALGVACIGVGASKIPGAKNPGAYMGMLLYAIVMPIFAGMVWWLEYRVPHAQNVKERE